MSSVPPRYGVSLIILHLHLASSATVFSTVQSTTVLWLSGVVLVVRFAQTASLTTLDIVTFLTPLVIYVEQMSELLLILL